MVNAMIDAMVDPGTAPTIDLVEGQETLPSHKDFVASLAARISTLSPGDKSNLRRMTIDSPARSAGLVTGLLVSAGVTNIGGMPDTTFRRWSILAHCAALLTGTGSANAHAPGWKNGLGRRLKAAKYSENRLMRLTAAKGPALEDQVVRAVRFIAQAGKGPIDLRTVRDLLDPDKAEAARMTIARSYYSAIDSTDASSTAATATTTSTTK